MRNANNTGVSAFGPCPSGELLKLAAELLREGLHTAEILEGYRAAYIKAQEILPTLVCHTVTDVRDAKQLAFAIKTVIGSKQYGFEVNTEADQMTLAPDPCLSLCRDHRPRFLEPINSSVAGRLLNG